MLFEVMQFGVGPAKGSAKTSSGSGSLPARDVQELWFATRRQDWSSLAVMPAWAGGSASHVADALKEVAGLTGRSARVVKAEGMSLHEIATLVMDLDAPPGLVSNSAWTSGPRSAGQPPLGQPIADMRPRSDMHSRAEPLVIVSVEPVVANPLVLPLALACSKVLLVLSLGVTDLDSAKHTVELVGADHILGCVLLRPR